MAARFRNCSSLQSVIDVAVKEFLGRTSRLEGYQEAIAKSQRGGKARP